MRSIAIGTVLAVGLTLASTAPTLAAPAYCPAMYGDPGTLLVHMVGTAWPLPRLALLLKNASGSR
jgi:hypothetical protein